MKLPLGLLRADQPSFFLVLVHVIYTDPDYEENADFKRRWKEMTSSKNLLRVALILTVLGPWLKRSRILLVCEEFCNWL